MGFICPACQRFLVLEVIIGPRLAHLPLATGEGDVDESSGVLEALESTALGDLGLLLLLNLYCDRWSVIGIVGVWRKYRGGEPWGSET